MYEQSSITVKSHSEWHWKAKHKATHKCCPSLNFHIVLRFTALQCCGRRLFFVVAAVFLVLYNIYREHNKRVTGQMLQWAVPEELDYMPTYQ